MSNIINLEANQPVSQQFKWDVQQGLSQTPKNIKSKYFYDSRGSQLFNAITRHPDYYLTRVELGILSKYKAWLSQQLGKEAFNLIELGPGEGIKTKILTQQLLSDGLTFRYTPIDISTDYLRQLTSSFKKMLPALEVTPIHADYFTGLSWQSEHSIRRNCVLFLGSSIGNFDPATSMQFLQTLRTRLHADDYVLLGFDLCKPIDILIRAYADSDGITREFNLNLLQRMNRELGAHFKLDQFMHYATYNVHQGAMESYLVSLLTQQVQIDALNQTFEFVAFEPIHVESSYKYQLTQIECMARQSGFRVIKHLLDDDGYFVNSLWAAD